MEPDPPNASTVLEETCGTTTFVCEYEGGIMMGADTRTTLGPYVSNRESDKITKIADNIYCCRSGSSADTQAICNLATYHMDLDVADGLREMQDPPLVYRAASLFRDIFRENEGNIKAAMIIAGWDRVKGSQVYALPSNGVLVRQNCALGGSGSSYILGYVDKEWRSNMKREDCMEFMKTALSLAMARDYASGGLINIGVMETEKPMEKHIFTQQELLRYCNYQRTL
uniref:proteasome endopeptidase complex n=1 Tax=Cacopsylla melanoneura TaxID=428564 RepID=A0A8D9BEX5_9HEMI